MTAAETSHGNRFGAHRAPLQLRILPDPVTVVLIEVCFAGHAAVVFLVPADRVEHEPAVVGAPVFVWLAGNHVVRQFRDERRHERVEFVRELSVRAVAEGLVERRAFANRAFNQFRIIGISEGEDVGFNRNQQVGRRIGELSEHGFSR